MRSHVRHPRLDRLPASGPLNYQGPPWRAAFVLERVMCCCEKPTINGEFGYKWQPNDNPIVRPVDPPMLSALEALLFDEPGRCGGLDCHSHHFRLVRGPGGSLGLMVRHGGGDEFFQLSTTKIFEQTVASLDSNARYLASSYRLPGLQGRRSDRQEPDGG